MTEVRLTTMDCNPLVEIGVAARLSRLIPARQKVARRRISKNSEVGLIHVEF